ncbi:hypothetical protein Plhal304r1_c003g0012591 [Plasmopara halstedii]
MFTLALVIAGELAVDGWSSTRGKSLRKEKDDCTCDSCFTADSTRVVRHLTMLPWVLIYVPLPAISATTRATCAQLQSNLRCYNILLRCVNEKNHSRGFSH